MRALDSDRGGGKETLVKELYLGTLSGLGDEPARQFFKKGGAGHENDESNYLECCMYYRNAER